MGQSTQQTTDEIADQVRAFTEEVIMGTPYFLVEIEVRGHKGTRVVEIFIDSDHELNHDNLARISQEIGFLLDVEDAIDGSYTLEVSSPGIKRPLKIPRQYKKNVGRTLRVKCEIDNETEYVTGELTDATDEDIELELPSGEEVRIPYSAIERAKIELPW